MTAPSAPDRARRRLVLGCLLAAALLAGAVYFPVHVASIVATQHRERHGTVTATSCTTTGSGRRAVSHCAGDFRSDDGELQVRDVAFTTSGRVRGGARRAALLAGPDDPTADVDGAGWKVLAVMSLAAAAMIAALVAQLVRLSREVGRIRRRPASHAPPA